VSACCSLGDGISAGSGTGISIAGGIGEVGLGREGGGTVGRGTTGGAVTGYPCCLGSSYCVVLVANHNGKDTINPQ
jgi:hypothetical protein